jgi:hypothetical protein
MVRTTRENAMKVRMELRVSRARKARLHRPARRAAINDHLDQEEAADDENT